MDGESLKRLAMNDHQPLHEGVNFPSPFTKVLAFGYYDGPTEGLVQCGPDGPVYRFDLLAWDAETQDLRVFGLAPLPADSLDRLASLFARRQAPRWPVWAPWWQAEWEPLTEQVLRQAGAVEWVIATCNLLGEIRAARPVKPEEVAQVRDWAGFLGLEQDQVHVAPLSAGGRSTLDKD